MNRLKIKGSSWALAAGLMLGSLLAVAGEMDSTYLPWLGKEITITSSPINDQIPEGGKLTFIYDSDDDVVRVCTRTAPGQRGPWRMDMAGGCNVALNFTRGQRFCTLEDVKAGDGEVLSQCHRLRSREVRVPRSGRDPWQVWDRDPRGFAVARDRQRNHRRHQLTPCSRAHGPGA
jgi:hypothetical protein